MNTCVTGEREENLLQTFSNFAWFQGLFIDIHRTLHRNTYIEKSKTCIEIAPVCQPTNCINGEGAGFEGVCVRVCGGGISIGFSLSFCSFSYELQV